MRAGGLNLLTTNDVTEQTIQCNFENIQNTINTLSNKRNENKDDSFEEDITLEFNQSPYDNKICLDNNGFYKEIKELSELQTINLLYVNKFENKYQYINQLHNGFILCHNENLLSIFDKFKKLLFEIYYYSNISCICELKNNSILFVGFDSDSYYLHKIYIDKTMKKSEEKKEISIKIKLILEIRNKEYIISCPEGTFYYQGNIMDITNNHLCDENRISEECFINGKIIDEKILILINNKNNEGCLLIYNLINKKKKLYNDLLKLFLDNLHVIKLNNEIYILLSCEKTNEYSVLLFKLKNNGDINSVYKYKYIPYLIPKCLCPIKNLTKMNILSNNVLSDTEYFLVGGDDKIKIYYINEELVDLSIELIANVKFGDSKENKNISGINAIKQLANNGNIIICFNNKEIKEFYLKG